MQTFIETTFLDIICTHCSIPLLRFYLNLFCQMVINQHKRNVSKSETTYTKLAYKNMYLLLFAIETATEVLQ